MAKLNLNEIAEAFPTMQVTITVEDLLKANKQLVSDTVKALEQKITDAAAETYPSVDKVCEMLDVTKPTLWRWEKSEYLVPVRIGGKVRYKMSDVKRILGERSES
jgi:hypothetical protein